MIVTVPADTPVISPVEASASAIVVLLLLQEPPDVASVSVAVSVLHREEAPEIAAGSGLTLIVEVAKHPVENV